MNFCEKAINLLDLMLFSHGLFIIESATGCSNGEPSELKMISAWVLGRSFNFFVRGEDVYVYISIYWCCHEFNGTSRNTKNYIDYHRKM